MLNMFKVKKWAAILLGGFIPTICFSLGVMFYGNFWIALGLFGAGMIVSVVISFILLNNPFSTMLEGSGLLCLDLNSTGVIRPFIVGIQPPYVKGKNAFGGEVKDVFDRATVVNLAVPHKVKSSKVQINNKGGIDLSLDEEEYNRGRFALFHYPVLIWNEQVKSLITKDFLSEMEKTTFAEHGIIYLNRKMEELTSVVRDFGRYVVELTKPKQNWLANKWVWIIIIIFVVILIALFAPSIINAIKGASSSVGGAVSKVAPTVQPVP